MDKFNVHRLIRNLLWEEIHVIWVHVAHIIAQCMHSVSTMLLCCIYFAYSYSQLLMDLKVQLESKSLLLLVLGACSVL